MEARRKFAIPGKRFATGGSTAAKSPLRGPESSALCTGPLDGAAPRRAGVSRTHPSHAQKQVVLGIRHRAIFGEEDAQTGEFLLHGARGAGGFGGGRFQRVGPAGERHAAGAGRGVACSGAAASRSSSVRFLGGRSASTRSEGAGRGLQRPSGAGELDVGQLTVAGVAEDRPNCAGVEMCVEPAGWAGVVFRRWLPLPLFRRHRSSSLSFLRPPSFRSSPCGPW